MWSPEVRNGLALCKIHHAAYDHNIIGINADYNIEVREDVLAEIDGPMLKHGLQEFNKRDRALGKLYIVVWSGQAVGSAERAGQAAI